MSNQITCNDRIRTYWTPKMERFFIDLMLEHCRVGNRTGHTFNKQAWNDMVFVFNAEFESQYDKDVLKSRYTNLWKQYNDVKSLLDHGGFSWDQTHQIVVGDEILWSSYLKAHPEAHVYKTKQVLNFEDLCLIYGYTVADGRYSRSSHDLECEDEINGVNNIGESSGGVLLPTKESSKTEWTPVMDSYFIELMLDQIGRGNKTCNGFGKQAWMDMLALFNGRFGGKYVKRVLRHRYNKLLKYYKDMEAILKEDGFSWDETLQMIAADDAVWASYIKEHPFAKTYRRRPSLPSYNDLDIIFSSPAEQGSLLHQVQVKELKDDCSGEQMNEAKASQVHSSDRTRTFWTPPMDHYLIDLLVDQVNKGNRVGQAFITSAWNEMITSFNAKFGSQHGKDVLKNRYKHLRRLYNDIKSLLEQNGFSWDTRKDMVIANDEIWNTYIQAHPEGRSYRVKTIPSYPNLCFIFGKEMSGRRYTRVAQAFDPIFSETVRMNESGSTDALKDTHSFQMVHASDEKNGYTCRNIGHPCIEWTQVMDRCLIDLMLEQVNRGNKVGEIFTEQAWADVLESFNDKFGLQADIFTLENRYILMMKEREDISKILSLGGFAWDEEKQVIIAEDEYWEAYIKEHPDATIYKGKTLNSYNDLCKIHEHLSQESFNCENLMIEIENYSHDQVDIADHFSSSPRKQPSKRKNPTTLPPLGLIAHKSQKTGRETKKPLRETEGDDDDDDDDCVKPIPPRNEVYTKIGNAIDALQALPDMDDELLLDACDLLEDERKAKVFLALDISLRKKWLMRKLRPVKPMDVSLSGFKPK